MSAAPSHIWVRAEHRPDERRVGLTPQGAAELIAAGVRVTVEDCPRRAMPIAGYRAAGCEIAAAGTWPDAPEDAVIFGLKELPDDGQPLRHRHLMFGHAFKGQPAGRALLRRFRAGGGTLYDLEYLVNNEGTRVAAFGYWAGYAGAAVALLCWAAQQEGTGAGAVRAYDSCNHLLADVQTRLLATGTHRPVAIVVGALGRVGRGATDLCTAMGVPVTAWDIAETAGGGPFPQILAHDLFFNCVLARPGTPVFVPAASLHMPRRLTVIGDIACDPYSDFSPVRVYDAVTTWEAPSLRVHEAPPLDVMAIDNLPSLLPVESSEDYAGQLLGTLLDFPHDRSGTWARARATFETQAEQV
ncbi:MAG: saccharopine dehydrogenase [Rhodobacteraceae bacterium]|nr:saccharopine dehydrogenase [Paracoccaceae bacterium]